MVGEFMRGAVSNWRPPEQMSLSAWADKYAYLSPESSAQAGKWRPFPYQVGIMDAFTDPRNEYVTWMKSARVGYTKILNHATAYFIAQDPSPILIVQPTIEDAQGHSKDEIAPMLRDTPVLEGLVSESKTRDSNNTILKKIFAGGVLNLVGANSARGFRRIQARVVLFDEIDGYPPTAGSEGDQIKLGIRRSEFFYNRIIARGSTPTIKKFSRIEDAFEQSDKRYYNVPCPRCGLMQRLKWSGIKWPRHDPERAYYECEACAEQIPHSKKRWMVERGEWVATEKFRGHAGFHIWAGYSFSPNAAWGKLAVEFLESKDDPEKLKTFVNTVLGETWEVKGEGVDDALLIGRLEKYKNNKVPSDRALVITAGVDVQKDRLELEFVAWAADLESWSLDYVVLNGDPEKTEVWTLLDEQFERTFDRPDGTILKPVCKCIDSGYATDEVYKYVYPRQRRRVFATKGQAGGGRPLTRISKVKFKKTGLKLYIIGVDTAKDALFARLTIDKAGPKYCHFPEHYPEDYFKQLTAERVFTKKRKGVSVREYRKTYQRNEALDCRVYNMAALSILNPLWDKLKAKSPDSEGVAANDKTKNDKVDKENRQTIRRVSSRRTKKRGGYAKKFSGRG